MLSVASHATARQLNTSFHLKVEDDFENLVYKYKHSRIRFLGNHEHY